MPYHAKNGTVVADFACEDLCVNNITQVLADGERQLLRVTISRLLLLYTLAFCGESHDAVHTLHDTSQ